MEQHAVPQDITGFKFKLVGDMTLKQFGELAGGAVIAYLFYATNWPGVIKWPFVLLFGFLGFALAFLPIEERSLDIWIVNFFKAIYKPTLFIWKKSTAPASIPDIDTTNITTVAANPLVAAPTPAPTPVSQPTEQLWPFPKEPPKPENKPVETGPMSIEDLQKMRDEKIKAIENTANPPKPETVLEATPKTPGPPVITIDDLAKLRDEKKIADETKAQELDQQNKQLQQQMEALKIKTQALAGEDTSHIENQIQQLQKQQEEIKNQMPIDPQTNIVKVVDRPSAKPQATISLTEIPNVINGIVSNLTGVPLDGTIIIIKDKAGNSIRALKTNQIGQFIASTPLENGVYYLEFERNGYDFDTLEITMEGKVITPLQIHGKNRSN